ncbi:hypothetical protein WS70_22725 [Burkholderia mayonis]|uniref:Uncharacterized protein n=2 Tax=Burkholderia mayonis TaxID=1385591 RepID=A0A1B4FLS5_9BURK|nr:hypothetical protein WS70_22725 [Burkholderia mayonis]KVE46956.1 hypothetical protein WS70_28345 [Burkholderia mayonis]
MLGMTAEPNYNNAPSVSQNIYRSVGDGFDGLTYARGFTQVWISDNSKHSSKLGIYMPKAPDGYIALGCVAVSDYRYPPVTPYSLLACVRQDLCEQVTLSSETNLIWTDENSGSSQNVSVWMLPTAQTCVATVQQSGYPSSVVVWDVKKPATAA